ncbi:TPA: hypothetical protein DF272_06275 [Candidatus Falkowbacteria bacterium]|nr:hypothetical protein [Candidatus Falkowbacteria bacterium]
MTQPFGEIKSESNRDEPPKIKRSRKKLIWGIILFVFGLLMLFSLFKFGSLIAFFLVFPWISEYLELHAALNPWLAKMIAILPAILFVISVGMILSFRRRKRLIGIILGSSAYLAFCGFMYYADANLLFDPETGEPKKCFSARLDSYVEVPCEWEIDPQTGNPVIRDPAEIKSLNRSKEMVSRPPITIETVELNPNLRLFTPDGQPLFWYYEHANGDFELFMQPGRHPQLNIPLKPIDTQVAMRLRYPNEVTDITLPPTSSASDPEQRSALEKLRDHLMRTKKQLEK